MEKLDVEKALLSGTPVLIPLTGYSMFPLFAGGRDKVYVEPVPEGYKFKRLDVVLYRREGSKLVLHRVYKVTEEGLYLVGDNQIEIEGPLPFKQARGILAGARRKNKYFKISNPLYRIYSWVWMAIRPIRPKVIKVLLRIKHPFKGK